MDFGKRGACVVRFFIFFVRAILGAGLSVIIMRAFYPAAGLFFVALLGVFLVAAAYGLEFMQKRKR